MAVAFDLLQTQKTLGVVAKKDQALKRSYLATTFFRLLCRHGLLTLSILQAISHKYVQPLALPLIGILERPKRGRLKATSQVLSG